MNSGAEVKESEEVGKRLKANRMILRTTLFCLSLELPFERFTVFSKSASLLCARLRFLGVCYLLIKLSLIVALDDCHYATWRAYAYDWTIYYPNERRLGVVRAYIGMLIFHSFLKVSCLFHGQRKPFDASLIDFLCSEPPTPRPPDHLSRWSSTHALASDKQEQQQQQQQQQTLRDRSHWFEMSDRLKHAFKWNLALVLPLSAWFLIQANRRLGFIYTANERACNIEMPMLRLIGLIELNFALLECLWVLAGSYCYCSMTRDDLLLQVRHVELYLLERLAPPEVVKQIIERPTQTINLTKHLAEQLTFSGDHHDLERMLIGISSADYERHLRRRKSPVFHRFRRVNEKEESDAHASDDNDDDNDDDDVHLSLYFMRNLLNHQQQQQQQQQRHSKTHTRPLSESLPAIWGGEQQQQQQHREQPEAEVEKHLEGVEPSEWPLVEAQQKVIAYLSCLETHKAPVNFIGNAYVFWLATSLSFVPLFVSSIHSASMGTYVIYFAACLTAMLTGLMFTTIFAQSPFGFTLEYNLAHLVLSKSVRLQGGRPV